MFGPKSYVQVRCHFLLNISEFNFMFTMDLLNLNNFTNMTYLIEIMHSFSILIKCSNGYFIFDVDLDMFLILILKYPLN